MMRSEFKRLSPFIALQWRGTRAARTGIVIYDARPGSVDIELQQLAYGVCTNI